MADGGVWARLPQPNNGGGIWTKTSSGWVEIGGGGGSDGLEGLGGWAEITEVTGSPKRYAYNDGSMDWVAFEWTDTSGTHTVTTDGGLADCLLVGGGSGAQGGSHQGMGGRSNSGLMILSSGPNDITVGAGGPGNKIPMNCMGGGSSLAGWKTGASGAGNSDTGQPEENQTLFFSSITGIERDYARSNGVPQRNGRGDSGSTGDGHDVNGKSGVVVVKVPAAQAAGVDPGSWVTRIDYYAEVTDGIVTDLYQERFYGDDSVRTENGRYASPEQPDDLIPCDPSVAEGWTYADGEFTPPPPDPSWREEAIAALKQQLKDLQKDT